MFLVFKLQRTGSTMFSAVLNTHPNVICQKEFLNPYGDLERVEQIQLARKYLFGELECKKDSSKSDAITARGITFNPFKHRFALPDLEQMVEGLLPDPSHSPRLIVLTRRNKLKQAVSICRAEEFNWKSSRTQFKSKSDLPEKAPLDVGRLEELVSGLEHQTHQLADWSTILSSHVCTIEYEGLFDDPKATFLRVFEFLGIVDVAEDFDFQAGHQKILSDRLSDNVENYGELRSRSLLAKYLDD